MIGVSVVQFIIENSKFYDLILSQNLGSGSGSLQFFPTLCRNLYVRTVALIPSCAKSEEYSYYILSKTIIYFTLDLPIISDKN
jgi:hypothetical protein